MATSGYPFSGDVDARALQRFLAANGGGASARLCREHVNLYGKDFHMLLNEMGPLVMANADRSWLSLPPQEGYPLPQEVRPVSA